MYGFRQRHRCRRNRYQYGYHQGDARILPGSGHSSPVIKNDAVIYGTVVGNVEISGFYELPPGEKLENHSREPLKIYADEYTGPLMGLREPQSRKALSCRNNRKNRSDRSDNQTTKG